MPNDSTENQEQRLFADAQGHMVEVIPHTDPAIVHFSAQGGGFVRAMPKEAFERQFTPASPPGFALTAVTGEWLPEGMAVSAYTNGQRWNGWAMPYFPFEAAMQLLPHTPNLRYDEATDAFINTMEGYPAGEDEESFGAQTLSVAGAPVKVYAIGTACWTWEMAD